MLSLVTDYPNNLLVFERFTVILPAVWVGEKVPEVAGGQELW